MPGLATRMKFEAAAFSGKTERQHEVCTRQVSACFCWPFDQAEGVAAEILAKPRFLKFFCFIETIKIKVIQV